MNDPRRYDVVIVGGGLAGSLLAKEFVSDGRSVLMLESGRDTGFTFEGYRSFVESYLRDLNKGPNSPYPSPPDAGDTDTPGYVGQLGPVPFSTDYVRGLGGTTLHWLGTCLRMLPADFRTQTLYGRGEDWPLAYEDLEPFYQRAEGEFGVSANVEDQKYLGVWFADGYEFPMYRIPPSYIDQRFSEGLRGFGVEMAGRTYPVQVSNTPQARNSIPNPRYDGGRGYEPVGAVGAPDVGLRCEGHSSCIPICPVQAKYNALKTLAGVFNLLDARGLPKDRFRLVTQAVASRLDVDPDSGRVRGVEYKVYRDDASGAEETGMAYGRVYVVAAHAIETAKLMLISEAERASPHLGHYLMDHPYMLVLGSARGPMGTGRGPSSTSGIESLRDGPFRREHAAFRIEVGNWGWRFATDSPYGEVAELVDGKHLFGATLRSRLHRDLTRQVHLGPLVEQLPEYDNRVTVEPGQRDPLGIPRPRIWYDVSDYTRAGMAAAQRVCQDVYRHLDVQYVEKPPPAFAVRVGFGTQTLAFYGAGHIVGTHRMGARRETSVVNTWQRSWDHDNLYLVGCGSMPTIGTSNPTLTMAALAYRSAQQILKNLR